MTKSLRDPKCTKSLREAGASYPRTCQVCSLGPCKFPDEPAAEQHYASAQPAGVKLTEKFKERFIYGVSSTPTTKSDFLHLCQLIDERFALTGETSARVEGKPASSECKYCGLNSGHIEGCYGRKPTAEPDGGEVGFYEATELEKFEDFLAKREGWNTEKLRAYFLLRAAGEYVRHQTKDAASVWIARAKLATFKPRAREMPSERELNKFLDGIDVNLHSNVFEDWRKVIHAALRAFPVQAEQPPRDEQHEKLTRAVVEAAREWAHGGDRVEGDLSVAVDAYESGVGK